MGSNYLYIDANKGYKFDLSGQHWFRVKQGTNSNGDADVEFSNQNGFATFVVFRHGKEETFNSISSFRFEGMYQDYSITPDCWERRQFVGEDGIAVISVSVCNSGMISMYSALIKVDGVVHELLGYHDELSNNKELVRQAMLATAYSFREVKK